MSLKTIYAERDSVLVHPWAHAALGVDLQAMGQGTFGSQTWTANLAVYIPFTLARPKTIAKFFWANGGTLGGNTDVGVYSFGLTKLSSSGPTANSGVSDLQVVDVTDLVIGPGRYWLALTCDSGTQIFGSCDSVNVSAQDCLGIKQEAAGYSSGLKASPTLSAPTVQSVPMFGFTPRSVI